MKAEFIGEVEPHIGLIKGQTYILTAKRASNAALSRPLNIDIAEHEGDGTVMNRGRGRVVFLAYKSLEELFSNWRFQS